ncbi:hydroxyproline O-galactosyltransferase GALT6-like isoform X2 [Rhododendron vialii]|uniref:hydroxyproline O-galactosyltransferase GALT6-like isoform X2 n=1 Tax=Rhododendron vialii TaxID=182163 RepID=UPI00265E6FE8|nr:hydroxyproline O-galactosyltransferase GALT6-like isoform X2 [Rhododendron vialii]
MKRSKMDLFASQGGQRSIQILVVVGFLYLFMMTLELPFVFDSGSSAVTQESSRSSLLQRSEEGSERKESLIRPLKNPLEPRNRSWYLNPDRRISEFKPLSSMGFDAISVNNGSNNVSGIESWAKEAFEMGRKTWEEIEPGKSLGFHENAAERKRAESCPNSVSLSGFEFLEKAPIMGLPCGLKLGSLITVVGKPRLAKDEKNAVVSQFMVELQGVKDDDGEDPPRMLHFNARLKGDRSRKPVIEQNTRYRMQWGTAIRCDGRKSFVIEETVDGQVKCEGWIRNNSDSEESKIRSWLNRLIGQTQDAAVWPYPFAEGKLFVLTLRPGLEGYHVDIDGRHVSSFPHRAGFTIEDATGLFLKGDIDVHSIFATSLPSSQISNRRLDMSSRWKAPPLPDGPFELFIGIISAGNHFGSRMGVRRSWMQHELIQSSVVVARFFVALHAKKEVNLELKKEADFFGDVVIVPYMDNYNLLVLKTVAIFEYGVRAVSAKYVMKCDDDTFVRVDAVMNEIKKVPAGKSFYLGNINYYHKPFRYGKWGVTYEEYAGEKYPPFANGPGYIVSSDIAQFIVSGFEKHKLRLFKMEDVGMGMWVEQFNSSTPVEYIHILKFCQWGCTEDYITAHYQSPGQMTCLWKKLQEQGRPRCCDMR